MGGFPALSLWTDSYLAKTADLSAEEHGVYLLLLMAAWRSADCALPDDDVRLARIARVGTKKWQKLRPVMERFWTIDARGWTQKRLLEERARVETLRSQKRDAANAKHRKDKETGSADADAGAYADATVPSTSVPNDYQVPSEPSANGASDEPEDLKSKLFGSCLDWLAKRTGKPADKFRPQMGKWCRDYGDDTVLRIMRQAAREPPVEPVAWIEKALAQENRRQGPSDEEIEQKVLGNA